jgi:hypothetical protein
MAYRDETEEWSLKNGVPEYFLISTYTCENGNVINPNPLYSYTFQANITDYLSPLADTNYSKAAGCQTICYLFSGLVGTPKLQKKADFHNKQLRELGFKETNNMLNLNLEHHDLAQQVTFRTTRARASRPISAISTVLALIPPPTLSFTTPLLLNSGMI